jgi:hypothetical protein
MMIIDKETTNNLLSLANLAFEIKSKSLLVLNECNQNDILEINALVALERDITKQQTIIQSMMAKARKDLNALTGKHKSEEAVALTIVPDSFGAPMFATLVLSDTPKSIPVPPPKIAAERIWPTDTVRPSRNYNFRPRSGLALLTFSLKAKLNDICTNLIK